MISTKELFLELRETELMFETSSIPNQANPMKNEISFPLPKGMTKAQMKTDIRNWVKQNGWKPGETFAFLKKVKDLADIGLKEIRPAFLESIDSDGAKVDGMEISTQAVVKWDYSDDPTWNELQKEMKALEAKIKNRESVMKTAAGNPFQTIIDKATGEEVQPAKRGETTLRINTNY